eukprot:3619972-Rhodomonas_salina.2
MSGPDAGFAGTRQRIAVLHDARQPVDDAQSQARAAIYGDGNASIYGDYGDGNASIHGDFVESLFVARA